MKESWETKKLSDIGFIFNGNTISEDIKKERYLDRKKGLPYIATKDVGYDAVINYDNGVKIPFAEIDSFKVAPKNTVFICAEGGSAGRKIGFTNQDVCFGNKLFAISTNKNVESKYVFYWYFSFEFQKQFKSSLAGLIGGVSVNKFREITIPVPSLPEQQRIVSVLDEAFESIAQAKSNAERNLVNARELFEAVSEDIFADSNDEWKEKELRDIAELIDCLHITPTYAKDGFPMVRATDVKSGFLDISNARKVDEKTFKEFSKKHMPKIGDVVLSRVGASYGTSALVNSNEPFCLGQNTVFLVPKINPNYFYYFLNSHNAKEQMGKLVAGAAQPTISLKSLGDLIVPVPPLAEQRAIVSKLEALSAETKRLEEIYQSKLEALDELKKSVLQKAFAGEL